MEVNSTDIEQIPEPIEEPSPTAGAPTPPRPFDAVSFLEGVDASNGIQDTVPTGFPSLDALLGGGPRKGDLIVLAGDVGCGKTSLALAIALRAAEARHEVSFFSGEYSVERLLERCLALEGRVRIDDLRHGTLGDAGRAAVGATALRLRDRAPMFSFMPPNGIGGLSDLLIDQLGLDLLVVDPVRSLVTGRLPLNEELASTLRDLKAMAVRRHCAVLAVMHVDADLRSRHDPRPVLEDLGALGAARHLADIVLGLFREEIYEPSNDVDGAVEVHVLKNRTGRRSYADLFFYKSWLRFEDMVDPDR